MRSRAVILGLVLVALFAFRQHQRNGLLGYMECWVVPQAWVNTDALRSWQGEGVVAHEDDHVAQAHEIGGCFRFNLWTLSKTNRMRGEARAYCESAYYATQKRGWSMPAAIAYYADYLADPLYDFALTPLQAADTISAYCGRKWEVFELK